MYKLIDLLKNLKYDMICGDIDTNINDVCFDTRKIKQNDLFICIKGFTYDSHKNIFDVCNIAKCIIVEKNNECLKGSYDKLKTNTKLIIVETTDTHEALATILNNYYNNPLKDLKIIAITGTKGKTTTSYFIRNILLKSEKDVGLIGTNGVFYGNMHIEEHNTTPGAEKLFKYFSDMRDIGIKYVVMEVSSQSLKYKRVFGINFYLVVWTNIFEEHISEYEHKDFDDYFTSKLKIFSMTKKAFINEKTDKLEQIKNVCIENNVDYEIVHLKKDFQLKLIGKYNLENANLAYAVCKYLGINEEDIVDAINETNVPGRSEIIVKNNDFVVIVDFSYEPHSAESFLKQMNIEKNDKSKNDYRRIVAVFGCGGNRAKERRSGLGVAAGKYADFVILTSDNSRFEKPLDIIKDIEETLTKYKNKNDLENGYIIKVDRKEAIKYAIENHKKGDIICIMGMGNDNTMEEMGQFKHYRDKEVILDIVWKKNS